MRNLLIRVLIAALFVAYITSFNYGGCGDAGGGGESTTNSGSSGTPTPTPIAPDQATSPTPANSATNVAVTQQLIWASDSGATSYDVFFGTSSPGTSIGNQAGTSYNPGTLNYSTTYYWRINSKNTTGTTTGSVWSFTTQSAPATPPPQVTSPTPANSATNAPITQQLSWATATGTTSYDVYFGTTSPGALHTNTTSTSYNPGTLTYSTNYYWRIDSKNSAGTTTGSVWSFTTQSPSPAQVTTPAPINGATNILVYPQLSWVSATGATSYDIYFGTTSPPSYYTTTPGTTYNPGTLSYSATYYWRIDSKNSVGVTTGVIWSFSTQSLPLPSLASSPDPTDGATNVPTTQQLMWASASNATSYNVYFGTTSPGTSKGNQSGTSYSPITLSYSTTYYWRIDAKNSAGTTTGIVWSFQTETQPVIPSSQVTSPNPVNGATNISITKWLGWASATGATSYDVYFGITTTGWTPVTNTVFSSYSPSVLSYSTTYYWRIDAKNSAGTTTGNIWSFQTTAPWAQVAAGGLHTIGLKTDGSIYAWGANEHGQLGDGTNTDKNTPTRIGTETNWSDIAAGYSNTIALKTDGSLWAWGDNLWGQLGDGTTIYFKNTPTRIGTDTNWSAIAAGGWHTTALKTDGSLYAWGWNIAGQLGDGTNTDKNTPTRIGTETNWSDIAAGGYHTIGLKTDGSLYAWGYNYYGQLGDGTTIYFKNTPTLIDTGWTGSVLSAGYSHTIALKTNGSLYAWGRNDYGQLGDGSTITRTTPTLIGAGWSAIAAVSEHTIALKNDGSLYAWGWNNSGQLGDGTTTSKNTPTLIGTGWAGATISAGALHTIALKTNGSLYAWGWNIYGQLGDGTYTFYRLTPTQVGQ